MEKITIKQFADQYNTVLTRRGHKMGESYIYRLIRQDIKGSIKRRSLWFKYVLEGEKDRIFILI